MIGLDDAAAPQTVENFEKLLRKKFYKGLKVHRIIPHALVQMGDPLSRGHDLSQLGTGGPGYTLPPEIHDRHIDGAVAMARLADPLNPTRRSSGSQFYICLKPMPNLDGQYTVFGHVLEGMDVLQTISAQSSDTNDNPDRSDRDQIREAGAAVAKPAGRRLPCRERGPEKAFAISEGVSYETPPRFSPGLERIEGRSEPGPNG